MLKIKKTLYSPFTQVEMVQNLTNIKPHTGHETHLCSMVEENGLTKTMKPLIKNGKYVCTCCARVATKKENLCNPESL